jgi:spore maturation protein CgeB
MRFVMFYHSLVSDWNHGNAHFLRGVVGELLDRGHAVEVYEPRDGWSLANLRRDRGVAPLEEFAEVYPRLRTNFYSPDTLDLPAVLDGADVALVHEWNDHDLVARVGQERARSGGFRLLFHDTHHRAFTDRESMARYDLSEYDGVLAFGRAIRDRYLDEAWIGRAWTWHEAADTRVFRPLPVQERDGDLVWIGNWGDEERTRELQEFLLGPTADLKLKTRVHGVRYPDEGRRALEDAGVEYAGWLPNYRVPETFARFRATVHIPRRPYRESVPACRRSASLKLWPAASRWRRWPGTTSRDCLRPMRITSSSALGKK